MASLTSATGQRSSGSSGHALAPGRPKSAAIQLHPVIIAIFLKIFSKYMYLKLLMLAHIWTSMCEGAEWGS